jgi:hypothetical protein
MRACTARRLPGHLAPSTGEPHRGDAVPPSHHLQAERRLLLFSRHRRRVADIEAPVFPTKCRRSALRQGCAAPTSSLSRSLPCATHDHQPSLGHCLAAVHPMTRRSTHPSSSCHTRSPVSTSSCHTGMTPRATGFAFSRPPPVEPLHLSPRQVAPPPTRLGSLPLATACPRRVIERPPNQSSSGQATACRELCSTPRYRPLRPGGLHGPAQ